MLHDPSAPKIITPGEMVKRTSRSLSGLTAEEFSARRGSFRQSYRDAAGGPPELGQIKILAQDLRVQNHNRHGITLLTLVHPGAEMAVAFSPAEARQLASALEEHARLLDEYAAEHPDDAPPEGAA